MGLFFISYCDDEAVFLVFAVDAEHAKDIWLDNRARAGFKGLDKEGIAIAGPAVFDNKDVRGGVADVTKMIFGGAG